MEALAEYLLFFAKIVTALLALIVLIAFAAGASQRRKPSGKGHIEVKKLNDSLDQLTQNLKDVLLNPEALKQESKEKKKQTKAKEKNKQTKAKKGATPSRLFVIDFDGDILATEVACLREEITAVLSVASKEDEVLLRLESPGGVVHGYGLAASQLQRIRAQGLPLTVAVDKVAASGGYMMACIGTRIIAAPFALLGSIGVVAQIPNFYRFLRGKDVDVEVLTAGEYKRTLTLFGENTEAGRRKFQSELDDLHSLFKDFVAENRPQLDTEVVGTGETWYGRRALEQQLVDELQTSDEYIVAQCAQRDVFLVKYVLRKKRLDRLMEKASMLLSARGALQADLPNQHIH